jgi:hypothetical protein
VLAPDAVPALDEAEDAKGVDVVAERDAVGCREGFNGLDMGPSRIFRNEISEEDLTAEIVDGGDQSPLLLGERGPKVYGGVVLNKSPDGGCQDFAVVYLSLLAGLVAAQLLGPSDDRVDRYFDIALEETIAKG